MSNRRAKEKRSTCPQQVLYPVRWGRLGRTKQERNLDCSEARFCESEYACTHAHTQIHTQAHTYAHAHAHITKAVILPKYIGLDRSETTRTGSTVLRTYSKSPVSKQFRRPLRGAKLRTDFNEESRCKQFSAVRGCRSS